MSEEELMRAFRIENYKAINKARLDHLAGLPLTFAGAKVADFGAGIGDHISFYLERGAASVTAFEARPENLHYIRARFMEEKRVKVIACDVQQLPQGVYDFDIGHAYGIFYHLGSPTDFIAGAATMCKVLVLETMTAPAYATAEEDVKDPASGLALSVRMPREDVMAVLKAHYPHVYATTTQPDHHEFPQDWETYSYPGRAVFVASKSAIDSPNLLGHLPVKQWRA